MIRCLINGIIRFLLCGSWLPHTYKQTYEPKMIIASATGFRTAENYIHSSKEEVFRNACLIHNTCIYCGKTNLAWYKDYSEWHQMHAENN